MHVGRVWNGRESPSRKTDTPETLLVLSNSTLKRNDFPPGWMGNQ